MVEIKKQMIHKIIR